MKTYNYFNLKISTKNLEFTIIYDNFEFCITLENVILMSGYFTPNKSDDYMAVSNYTRSVELFADVLEVAVRKSLKSNKDIFKSIVNYQLTKRR